jgi:p-hydroxybenzoate 3-monooxygenase
VRTQVAIVGAGPAGLVLGHLLAEAGIESVVLESRSREYVESRVRAGVLEHGTVTLLDEHGVGERMRREGMVHHGVRLRFDDAEHRIDLFELTGGRSITVYGQQEVVKDVIAARLRLGADIRFSAEVTGIDDVASESPVVRVGGDDIRCDFVAGCDGFHGVSRTALPSEVVRVFEREYPFAWLGVLAQVPPSSEELIYAYHQRGFALHSMRTPEISRLYLQCPPDEDLANWPDARIWAELQARLGVSFEDGPILERGITAMRSFVLEPMQFGRLFLAGDAAHIVPPTGAKGMNLAIADARVLASALMAWYRTGDRSLLDAYSATCLQRVWRAAHFSWWMTSMLHRFPHASEVGDFEERLQLSQLRYVTGSRAASTTLAENYVGAAY